MPSFERKEQDRHISRVDPRQSTSLTKGGRAKASELLARFIAQTRQLLIIEVVRDGAILHFAQACHLTLLPYDVAAILTLNLDEFGEIGGHNGEGEGRL